MLTAVFAAVAGILLFTSEAQHGTLATALTAQPARWVIAAAKTVDGRRDRTRARSSRDGRRVSSAPWLGGLELGDTSIMATTTLWALLFTALAAALRAGRRHDRPPQLRRHLGLLVWWLVVENLLTLFLPERISRFLPFVAGNNLLGIEGDTVPSRSRSPLLSPGLRTRSSSVATPPRHWLSEPSCSTAATPTDQPRQPPAIGG